MAARASDQMHATAAMRSRRMVQRHSGESQSDERWLPQALGWFSVGLGVTEVLAPRALGRAIGVGEHPALMRLLGVRELVSGVGLLSNRHSGFWAWSRVAGDAVDLALLGAAARNGNARPQRIAVAATTVLGTTAVDVYSGRKLSNSLQAQPARAEVTQAVTINASPQTVYEFWRSFDNLPLFMRHVLSVHAVDETTSHWVVRAPAGTTVEWDARVMDDVPGKRLAWQTLPDSEIAHEGTVSFEPAPGERGTVVRVNLTYEPPAGAVGRQVARLAGEEPAIQIKEDLRRLKQLIETGEIATTDGQPHGRRSVLGRAMRRRLP